MAVRGFRAVYVAFGMPRFLLYLCKPGRLVIEEFAARQGMYVKKIHAQVHIT